MSRSTGKPIATIAVPIMKDSITIGVLGASIEFEHINQIINNSKLAEGGYAYIVDQYGSVIVHPDSGLNDEMQDVSHLKPVQSVVSGKTGVGTYQLDGVEKLVAFIPLTENSWGVLVQSPIEEAYKELNETVNWLILVFIITAVFLSIGSLLLSSYFMKPIKETVRVIKQIEKKNYVVDFENERQDELGLIQHALKGMANEVNESHAFLEKRVEDRTSELHHANQSLEEYVDELEFMKSELMTTNLTLSNTIDKLNSTQKKLIESEKITALGR